MNPEVVKVGKRELLGLISSSPCVTLTENEVRVMEECVGISQNLWAGFIHDDLACAWGLISPSILSNQAYLWLFTTSLIDQEKFLFIRHSQRQVEEMLKRYPNLVGFCDVNNHRAIRWVRWLGGVFKEPIDGRAHFRIEGRKDG